jgi:hypothetical protein
MRRGLLGIGAVVVCLLASATDARADRLCDPAAEDCREILLNLIRAERTGIDVAFWFMEDGRYTAELIRAAQAGVPVRVLVDPRANAGHPVNAQLLDQLRAAGIPMRQRTASGILHWKMMLFAGQRQVEFSGANYSPDALVYTDPYRNFVDEAIMFSDDAAIVQSFMQRFDDLWTNTTSYANYANIAGSPARRYPGYAIAPELNFPPSVSYRDRAVSAYNAETSAIDVIMYRITDRAHTDAIIAAVQRGVRVRLYTEQEEYRNASRPWHSWNVDRLYMAGVEIRHRAHAGLNHQKSVLLHSQRMTIFGSSNWTSPSNQSQEEHNDFTTKPWIFTWFTSQFERKWNNTGAAPETQPFGPLPPAAPVSASPANGAVRVPLDTALTFDAGPFAHLYDIYFGTTPNPPLLAANAPLGPNEGGSPRVYQLPALASNTTYYWRVVAKTMALQTAAGPVWSFSTGATLVTPPIADLGVYRRATGEWSILRSSGGSSIVRTLGGPDSLPVSADYDGDGKKDIAVYNLSSGVWSVLTSSSNFVTLTTRSWGGAGYLPVAGDYDGDGKADYAVYQVASGTWSVLLSGTGFATVLSRNWGGAGYLPVPGDYDGDGRCDIGVYRKATGAWSILRSTSGYSTVISASWGGPGYVPVPADYDGDGRLDLGLYQTTSGNWYVLTSASSYAVSITMSWGGSGYTPVPADYDGDNKADFGVYQQSTGTWSILKSSSGYTTTLSRTWGGAADTPVVSPLPLGFPSDLTRAGDFDGDTRSDLGLYQQSTGVWLVLTSGSNYASNLNTPFGGSGYLPVPGDYDGDGKADIGVYRSSTGVWSILKSSTSYTTTITLGWGGPGYQAVPGDYDGDGRTDVGVYETTTGIWSVLTSSSGFTSVIAKGWGGTGYQAVPADFDGDGRTDFGLYVQSTGAWQVLTSISGYTSTMSRSWGGAGYAEVAADYDGDGKADFGLYVPATGAWLILTSGSGYTATISKTLGGSSQLPVAGDYDGDGSADLAVYHATTGVWTILTSSSGFTFSITKNWGGTGYTALPIFP